MIGIYEVLTLVRNFDLRNDLNSGSYSLLQAAKLKLMKQKTSEGALIQKDHIATRRAPRSFPILCMVVFF